MTTQAPWGERHPWYADDPARSCYTCGHAPTGTFRDGSPRYDCHHEPVTAPQAPIVIPTPCVPGCRTTNDGVPVFVPDDMVRVHRRRAQDQARKAKARGWHHRNGGDARADEMADPDWAVAEYGVSVFLGVPLDTRDVPGGPDLVDGTEVRYGRQHHHGLPFQPGSRDQGKGDRPFHLVTGPPVVIQGGLVYRLRGWTWGRDGMTPANWWTFDQDAQARGRRDCWIVRSRDLHHPDHLPGGVASSP